MQSMAAGQRKKKLNGASVITLNFYEHNVRKKKMKVESSDVILNMTSHVSLEWDERENKVVAKREQIGLSWRDMAPFLVLDHVPEFRTSLADVLSVPPEIFGLENIADVLSYEVWEASLSERERKLLIQFLPKDVDVDDAVQSLLAGENFHFGNPFCKWGASLCAGDLHPDAIINMERQLRVTRNYYFCELTNYRSGIIENLSKLKGRWPACKDPEKQNASKYPEKENAVRIWREGTTKAINRSPPVALEKTKVLSISEKEQPQNTCFHYGDTAKYMSYIKINKKQHQVVKSINHSGDGVHSDCLNHVLGDIKGFHIQPYGAFEEEERKKLHEHWLQLSNKDILVAFENRRDCRLLRDKWWKGVQHELVERVMSKEETKNVHSPVEVDNGDSGQESSPDMQDEEYVKSIHFNDLHHLEGNPSLDAHQDLSPTFLDQEHNSDILKATTTHSTHRPIDNFHVEKIPSLNSAQELKHCAVDQAGNEYTDERATTSPAPSKFNGHEDDASNFNGHEDDAEDAMESRTSSENARYLERIPSLNSHRTSKTVDVHEDVNQRCPVISQFVQCVTTAGEDTEQNLSVSSPKDIWQGGSTDCSYHQYSSERSTAGAPAAELALQQPQRMKERSTLFIDLEAQILEREAAESVTSALHDHNRAAMFSPNANQDHSLLLPPFRMQGTSPSYSEEHLHGARESGLQFLVTNDGLRPSNQFPRLLHDQQQLFQQSQARGRGLYMQPMLNRNVHSNSRYPSQEHFLSIGSQDLTNFQSPLSSGLAGHNWFTGVQDTRNDWSGAESFGTSGQCIGDAGSADGSLFSVLSEYNKLPSHSPFVTTNSEAFLSGGNFVSVSNPHNNNTYAYAPVPSDASRRDAAALKINSMPWMNFFSLQNRGL